MHSGREKRCSPQGLVLLVLPLLGLPGSFKSTQRCHPSHDVPSLLPTPQAESPALSRRLDMKPPFQYELSHDPKFSLAFKYFNSKKPRFHTHTRAVGVKRHAPTSPSQRISHTKPGAVSPHRPARVQLNSLCLPKAPAPPAETRTRC